MSDRCETCHKPTSYQGWPNYETWAVKLWIDNDHGEYDYWTEQTAEVWADAEDAPALYTSQTRSDRARSALADLLKDYYDESMADRGITLPDASMYTDLMNAALSEVEWYTIAESLLSDTDGYEARK